MANPLPVLSACVVVRDAERLAVEMAERLLESLADLTPHFELVVVDAGSRDASHEALAGLMVRYPQMRVLSLYQPLGYKAALRQGLVATRGRIVLYAERPGSIAAAAMLRAWQQIDSAAAVFVRSKLAVVERWVPIAAAEPTASGLALGAYQPMAPQAEPASGTTNAASGPVGFQFVRREVLEALRWVPIERVELMVAMAERRYDFIELQFDPRAPGELVRRDRATPPPPHVSGATSAGRSSHGGARRPNYMDRLKRFALGE